MAHSEECGGDGDHWEGVWQTLDTNGERGERRELHPSCARTAADLAILLLLISVVLATLAHAPSNQYAYAQLRRVSTAISMLTGGEWLLPGNQAAGIASKPQLYPWLTAMALHLTGLYDDVIFRLPTLLATAATGVLLYFLARRWYGRRVALLAGCFWISCLHMQRVAYLAATDMLLTLWVTVSIFCADRLLFHRCVRRDRWKWAVGLWASMILGALSKGWGVVNLALVGTAVGLAVVVAPGFGALRRVRVGLRWLLAGRLALRRLARAMGATGFGWGVLAMAAVLGPLWIAMFLRGGEAFQKLVYFEFFQRFTGHGQHAPSPSSAPAIAHLLYSCIPASAFAIFAVLQVPLRRWFSRAGAIYLPLSWVLGVLVPFSLAHGFRPDYLLPCYGAVAMLAAWGVERIARRTDVGGAGVLALRRAMAVAAVVMCLGAAILAGGYALREHLGSAGQRAFRMPASVAPETWWVLYALAPLGVALAGAAVVWSRRLRPRRVAVAAMLGCVGIMFSYTHMASRHARTGDGDAMRTFARQARGILCDERPLVFRTHKLSVELYLGRLGRTVAGVEEINRLSEPWLITTDRGLCRLGACRKDAQGRHVIRAREQTDDGQVVRKVRMRTLPEAFGDVALCSRAVESQNWGRIYLIRLRRPLRPPTEPVYSAWESGKRREDDDE